MGFWFSFKIKLSFILLVVSANVETAGFMFSWSKMLIGEGFLSVRS